MITIQNLSKTYSSRQGQVVALSNVNLAVNAGEIFGIIGMSGAGKSTLVRCLSMLEEPTSGSIILEGQDVSKLTGKAKRQAHRKMGVVFQGYNLLMQRTVFENVAFPLRLAKHTKEQVQSRVNELLALVGLSDKEKNYPSQLSGGQKQRVALARALATSPKVLLCDEPTSALDPLTTKSVLELLRDINRKLGVTIIIITHEIEVVRYLCGRVAVIDTSQVVETGNTKEVFASPKSEITCLLLGKEQRPDE